MELATVVDLGFDNFADLRDEKRGEFRGHVVHFQGSVDVLGLLEGRFCSLTQATGQVDVAGDFCNRLHGLVDPFTYPFSVVQSVLIQILKKDE